MKKIMLDESRPTRKKESVLKEAKLLSRLKHPHIVTCRSFFFDEFDDHLCIIQDFCDDGTIFDKIRLEQVLPYRTKFRRTKFSAAKNFRRTKFSAPSPIFGSFVRRNFFIGFLFPHIIHKKNMF